MKVLVVYVSTHHGNTRKIAEVIAEVLQAPLKRVDEVSVGEVEDYELMGFGSGIYGGRHHKVLVRKRLFFQQRVVLPLF